MKVARDKDLKMRVFRFSLPEQQAAGQVRALLAGVIEQAGNEGVKAAATAGLDSLRALFDGEPLPVDEPETEETAA